MEHSALADLVLSRGLGLACDTSLKGKKESAAALSPRSFL